MVREYNTDTTADDLPKDLPGDIKGKVILITGVTQGTLGGVFVEYVAKAAPAGLILAGRSLPKVQETADALKAAHPAIDIRTLQVDLASIAAVREAAATVNSWEDIPHIDVVVDNAGIMAVPYATTVDGFELQLGSNHLGPFVFANLIMDKILASKSPHVVNIASTVQNCQHAMAISLAEELGSRGLTAFSLHPGTVITRLGAHIDFSIDGPAMVAVDRMLGNSEGWRDGFKCKTLERGVATHIYAAFEPSLEDKDIHNGVYLEDVHIADPYVQTVKPWGTSKVEAGRLWKLSEKLVGQEFSY
ncbi:hypothetical protein V8C34DRAFT_312051 [Trichoderma compactum]